ncbi:MAG: PP2C family serine/threonine-protein phosphatase [Roseiflexaceae bacterium]
MWRIANAKVIGTSHQRIGTPCQDGFYVMTYGDTLIVAVSDGLGSAAHSEIGSALVSKTAVSLVAKALEASKTPDYAKICNAAFEAARAQLVSRAETDNNEVRDYACTLLLVILTPTQWAIQHIGDGAVVGIATDKSVRTLSTPDNGEFINSTYPLTSIDYASHMRYATGAETLYGIAVVSDGVQPMCINYKTGAAYPGFFTPLVSWLTGLDDLTRADGILESMLDSAQFRQKSDDDMTLVLAVRA